jgi:Fe-S oxidoreductase
VVIIDEKVEGPVDPDTIDADVVGLSFKSVYSQRGYALADRLRARGVTVVLGGVHVTNVPKEASQHADVVCIGEGEPVWRTILDDIAAGNPNPTYTAPMSPRGPLNTLPTQRFDLLRTDRYMVHASQSARGCTFDCEFCPTRRMFGAQFRQRSLDALVNEVESLLRLEDKPVFFTENVFGAGDMDYVGALSGRLDALGARYGVIIDWVMVRPDMMKLLAANGCQLVCINLTGQRGESELAAVRAIHDAGMAMWGYIMFGFEEDTPAVFQGAIDTVNEYGIACASLTLLAPYPGTPMGNRLAREDRILSHEMAHYDQCHVVHKPAQMTAVQLQEGYDYVCRELAERADFVHAVRGLGGSVPS